MRALSLSLFYLFYFYFLFVLLLFFLFLFFITQNAHLRVSTYVSHPCFLPLSFTATTLWHWTMTQKSMTGPDQFCHNNVMCFLTSYGNDYLALDHDKTQWLYLATVLWWQCHMLFYLLWQQLSLALDHDKIQGEEQN